MSEGRPQQGAPASPPPRLQSLEDVARPGSLRRAVAELEEIVGPGDPDAPGRGEESERAGSLEVRLGELASAPVLATLFRLALVSAVRRGPAALDDGPSPARLFAAATIAAATGRVALPFLLALRASLTALESELHAGGAWAREEPPWWHPLPTPGPLESRWRRLEQSFGRALGPSAGRGGSEGWLHLTVALPPELLGPLQEQLDRAVDLGIVDLSPGVVGASAARSRHRSDSVLFLTGLEARLLAELPDLAVLVQWLLSRGADRLGRELFPGRALYPPQTAMLARYRAPASGFDPHVDNPGGRNDNGRALTAVVYLGFPGEACTGGELLLWPPERPADRPPAARLAAVGGSAVLFDARRIPHAVRPLEPGPDRWTLVVWLNEASRRPPNELLEAPRLTLADALSGVEEPPVPRGRVIFRQLHGGAVSPEIAVRTVPQGPAPRVGVVTTVRPAGDQAVALGGWVRHHLDLGVDHLLVILDEPPGAGEAAAVRRSLQELGGEAMTVWSAREARRRWPDVAPGAGRDRPSELRCHAAGGPAAWAVAARQSLNASAGLAAARGDELGGRPLDWLVHLDADELLVVDGPGRGGATLADHFAAAREAGLAAVRYANHELLLPWEPGRPLRFKLNPLLAVARLGRAGWEGLVSVLGMAQEGPHPYFRAYWNGKSAVAVDAGEGAAGVHGWQTAGPARDGLLAGPSVLHVHLPTPSAFRGKYLRLADGPDAGRPFPPSWLEEAARRLIRELSVEGASPAVRDRRLDALYAAACCFSPREVELLEMAGLLIAPELGPGRLLAAARSPGLETTPWSPSGDGR